MQTIGFIGLGKMGGNMAARYLASGYTVYGEARDRNGAQWLVDQGLRWVDTPREVAQAADIVMTSLPNDEVVESVATGPDSLLAGLCEGKLWADLSTIRPGVSRKLAARVRSEGRGAQMLAFSEGLLLAERDGIDPDLAAQVMAGSAIGSPMLKARLPLVLDRTDETWFDVGLMHKDIRLARQAGDELATPLPAAAAADEILTRADDLGYGHRDIAAIHEVLAKLSAASLAAH